MINQVGLQKLLLLEFFLFLCRWEAQLRSTLTLTDLNTGKEVALFQADGSLRVLPWKAEDKIKISRSCHDSTWMRLVIASGIIEADRIGGRRWF